MIRHCLGSVGISWSALVRHASHGDTLIHVYVIVLSVIKLIFLRYMNLVTLSLLFVITIGHAVGDKVL